MRKKTVSSILGLIICLAATSYSGNTEQSLFTIKELTLETAHGVGVSGFVPEKGKKQSLAEILPFFSVDINDTTISTLNADVNRTKKGISINLPHGISAMFEIDKKFSPGWKAEIRFANNSQDTVKISNMVPFGKTEKRIYLTASGPWSLARTKIFRPGLGPVGVVLPDNAWNTGYGDVPLKNGQSVCAITRRTKSDSGTVRRWWTLLPPGADVQYVMYADGYTGAWQNGLRLMFQQRYLYDLQEFDNTLYERKDLAWVRNDYVITTQMAWDHDFYDPQQGGYTFDKYLEMGKKYFGGWDIYILWPTWPTLGLDQRNQWDLYRDLPGGLNKIRQLSEYSRQQGTRFFISYNPWDQSTRKEDPYQGMAKLLKATDADGVILDTYGSSSDELQKAADSVKPGIVMYSEGMAVPKDMPGIITGRVHDAILMPPPLNMNKFIKPQNAIFRVCQLHDGEMHRETSVAFFNGYGVEINVYRPGRPAWMEDEYLYLGKLAKILRENSSAFLSQDWTPLISTCADSIWVNKWPDKQKMLYTVFSLIPQGFNAPLFEAEFSSDSHFVSLYHHEEITPDTLDGKTFVRVKTDAFNREWLGTRKEGNVDCIACFPKLLDVSLHIDSLSFSAKIGDKILIWKGEPSYQSQPRQYPILPQTINLTDAFGRYEGNFVVQLMKDDALLDERVVTLPMQTPRLISGMGRTKLYSQAPEGMLKIPGSSEYFFKNEPPSGVIPYPDFHQGENVAVRSFYMDKFSVTNAQFKKFLDASQYQPKDTVNFLKNWKDGSFLEGQGNYPVVYVSYEDAGAYARWAGKRLPTEMEWQYAAQGGDALLWPWGNEFDSTRCNVGLDKPTAVDAFPAGSSKFGAMDLVGNVWQLTNDLYDDGCYYFIIIRGGSYYDPTSSWWYVKGGPQPLNKTQMLLRVNPGFERNATVGFRCAADAE